MTEDEIEREEYEEQKLLANILGHSEEEFEETYRLDKEVRDKVKERFITAANGKPPTKEQKDNVSELARHIEYVAYLIIRNVPEGRNKALALTALEDVQMRANRGIFADAPKELEPYGVEGPETKAILTKLLSDLSINGDRALKGEEPNIVEFNFTEENKNKLKKTLKKKLKGEDD